MTVIRISEKEREYYTEKINSSLFLDTFETLMAMKLPDTILLQINFYSKDKFALICGRGDSGISLTYLNDPFGEKLAKLI